MKLSDSFVGDEGPASLEVIAEVRNIDEQYLGELGQACPTLAGYAHFVALVREARENGLSDEEAIDQALQRCVNEGFLVEYLSRKRAEVKDMFMTEFDEERYRRNLIREGRVEGRKEGREEARDEMLARIADSIRAGEATVELAVSLGFTRDEVESRVGGVRS